MRIKGIAIYAKFQIMYMVYSKSLIIVITIVHKYLWKNMKGHKSMKKKCCLNFIPLNLLLFPLWNHHNIMGI